MRSHSGELSRGYCYRHLRMPGKLSSGGWVPVAILLRDFRQSDLEKFFEMDQRCFAPVIAYSRARFRSILRQLDCVGIVAEDNHGRMAGFILAETKQWKRRRIGHIITIDVDPDMRRMGIGAKLMHAIEERYREQAASGLLLEVAERNASAHQFYSWFGFIETGQMDGYYPDGDSAFMMEKIFS